LPFYFFFKKVSCEEGEKEMTLGIPWCKNQRVQIGWEKNDVRCVIAKPEASKGTDVTHRYKDRLEAYIEEKQSPALYKR
jgi:hypothetical protein